MKETRFKQTEIGLIPEDWEIRKLGSIFKFIPNNTISRDNLVNQGTVMNVHYGDILIKYDSILDIKNNEIPFINDSVISNSKFNEFAKDGDILIADTAEDEMVCKATELYNIENRKLVSGLHTMWIRPITEFKPKYLGYFFNSTFYHNQILPLIQGTKVCSVSKGAIKDTYISIPLENEQNKIASALTSIDNLLLSLDKLIEKKRLIKQGAMQELLTGKKRLPGFTGEWIERRLGDMLTVKHGYPFKSEEYQRRGNFLIVTISNVQDGYFEWGVGNYIDNIPYNLQRHQKLEIGDILVSLTGNIGRICKVDRKNCLLNQRVGVLRFTNDKLIDFIYYRLHHTDFIYSLYAQSKGVAQQNIGSSEIEDFKFYMPSDINEVKAISSIIKKIEADIITIEKKRAKYEQIKQGMMQQLLTGKIRLIS